MPRDNSAEERQALEYLSRHPDFLTRHPALLNLLTPPAKSMGEGVEDFQAYQLKTLQARILELSGKHQELVEFCRSNFSLQTAAHAAALKLMRAVDLGQLLETIVVDLAALFNVDVVRLALEYGAHRVSDAAYGDPTASGISLIEEGMAAATFPKGKKALLTADSLATPLPVFAQVFADCSSLIRSYALLKLELPHIGTDAILAMGIRHPGRFSAGQSIEPLIFLGDVTAYRLSHYFRDLPL